MNENTPMLILGSLYVHSVVPTLVYHCLKKEWHCLTLLTKMWERILGDSLKHTYMQVEYINL